jgi:5-methylcytosine-specific restriction endonuclease McrA
MQRVLVLDINKQPLMPCHPARARQLLREGKAVVYRRAPFTIILRERAGGETQPVELKLDPGSKTTGIAMVVTGQRGRRVVWAAELHHRGERIRKALADRRAVRRSRRQRKTRYRKPRFLNRTRKAGWLPPSLESRVANVETWVARLRCWCPITSLALELVRFDTQALQQPEITGVQYQQGTLHGYEVREYLLEKWQRRCAYCGAQDVPLQIEHIVPKTRGGSDRVSNLTLACDSCNQKKGSQTAAEFGHPHIQAQARQSLKDAAAVNATRWRLYERLKATGLPIACSSGGRTKFNRTQQDYPKAHWIDAACVGETGSQVRLDPEMQVLSITAMGHGTRQMCRMDKYGFPRTSAKSQKRVRGFQTGDLVRATVPRGKHQGTHVGRVAVRTSGSFRVGTRDGIGWKHCAIVQRADGYEYGFGTGLKPLKQGASSHRSSGWVSAPEGTHL